MATMLTRVIAKAEINTTVDLEYTPRFADNNDINDWGKTSIYFTAGLNIINCIGNNKFNGLGNAEIEEAIAIAFIGVEVFGK